MVFLTEKYSFEKLSDCVCLNIQSKGTRKESKEDFYKIEKRYCPNIKMALKWFVSNYVEDNTQSVEGVVKSVNEAIMYIENASEQIKELLNE